MTRESESFVVRVGDFEELQNNDGETYTAYPITIESSSNQSWQLRRRYKHFWELYQALKNRYPEVELFDFPQKSMFRTSSDKLFRKESFHIFLNLLLTLQPMPKELEHFLEIKKHSTNSNSSSVASSRFSFDSVDSLSSRPSIDSIQDSENSSLNTSTPTNTSTTSSSSPSSSSPSSTKVPVMTLTPMALFAYILLFSTWVGSLVWFYIKGTEQETLFWTNICVLIISLYLIKQDREIVLTHHNLLKIREKDLPVSPTPPQVDNRNLSVSPESSSSSSSPSSSEDWLQSLNGTWKIIRQENAVESWYPMAGINFLIRPIALTVLMTLIKTISISNNILEIERSFNGKKYWRGSIKIGKNKETAEVLETELDGIMSYYCCWADEKERALFLEFEPFDQMKGVRVTHRREVLPNGELKMSWDGVNLGTGATGVMTTYFRKEVTTPSTSSN